MLTSEYTPKPPETANLGISTYSADGVSSVPNCQISITDVDNGAVTETTTDDTGKISIPLTKGRNYKIVASDSAGNEGTLEFSLAEDMEVSVVLRGSTCTEK